MDHRVFGVVTSGPVTFWKRQLIPLPWEPVPTHPVIAEKPESGRRISTIYPYQGNILLGYGDWTANTGPVKVVGFNESTLEPVTLMATSVPSEAFDNFREIDGAMYIPWIDPTNSNQGGLTTNEGGVWHNENIGGLYSMLHTFDIAKLNGLLYACGATTVATTGKSAGVVWRRNESGVWSKVLQSPVELDLARFYGFNDPRWGIEFPEGTLTVKDAAGSSPIGQSYWTTSDGINWERRPAPIDNTPFTPTPEGQFTKYLPWHLHPSNNTQQFSSAIGEKRAGYFWAIDNLGRLNRTPVPQ